MDSSPPAGDSDKTDPCEVPADSATDTTAAAPRKLTTLEPIAPVATSLRQRLSLKDEFILATAPTAAILGVLWMIELLSQQRVLFASLASSAFLIYLDPNHKANSPRSIALSQLTAALVGVGTDHFLGAGYYAAGIAMVLTIVLIIAMDAVHPPAVGTALSFAFRRNDDSAFGLFLLSLLVILILVLLQRTMLRVLTRLTSKDTKRTA